MLKISMVTMPLAFNYSPSFALTQLDSVLKQRFDSRISVDTCYINQDFSNFIGDDFYEEASWGYGAEWLFRRSAFPDAPDNTDDLLNFYFSEESELKDYFTQVVLKKLEKLDEFLDQAILRYKLHEARIVAFTSVFGQNVASFAMAKRLKRQNKDVTIVMGGPNCTYPMGLEILKNIDDIDYVFSGPGLVSFPDFVQYTLEGKEEKYSTINGLFSKTIHPPQVRGDHRDINDVVDIDYSTFLDSYKGHSLYDRRKPMLILETSRGCFWGKCTFCGLDSKDLKYSQMSEENAIKYLKSMFTHSEECKSFFASDVILPKKYISNVFPYAKIPPGTILIYEVKAILNLKDFKQIKGAGIKHMFMGIEAVSTPPLKALKKGADVFKNVRHLIYSVIVDINATWNILVEIPGLDESVYKNYIDELQSLFHLPPPKFLCNVEIFRYSDYFHNPEEFGIELVYDDFYDLVYPFKKDVKMNMAYFFKDKNGTDQKKYAKWKDEITQLVEQWTARFYVDDGLLHPKLFFNENSDPTIVYDTRSGYMEEHNLSPIGIQILIELESEKDIEELRRQFNTGNIDEEINKLKEKRLLFNEENMFLSLVCPFEPEVEDRIKWPYY
jgi:ribosomal peptide maturation radical SAM protein 1